MKPWDWVNTQKIPDPKAMEPDEWDENEDGKLMCSMKNILAYEGRCTPPSINKPTYTGERKPRRVDKPGY